MLKFQNLVSSSILLSPSLSSSDSLMSSNLFFGFGASTLSLATPSSPFSKSSAALILRKHPSLLLSLRSFHWGSSAVARWRKSPSTLLLPLSTKSSRTASLRCVWCQHDSDLDCLAVGVAYLRCSIKLWLLNWRVPALIVTHSFSTNLSN